MSFFKDHEVDIVFGIYLICAFICLFITIYAAFNYYNSAPTTYDCSIVEISPDIPLEVKEECRELIKEQMI